MLPLPSSGQCHYTVAFSPCGRWLAAGGSDHALDVWDLHAPQQPARRLQSLNASIIHTRFIPDGGLIGISAGWLGHFDAGTLSFRRARQIGMVRRAVATADGAAVLVFDGALHSLGVDAAELQVEWSRAEPSIAHTTDLAAPGARVVTAVSPATEPDSYLEVRNAGTGLLMDTLRVSGRPNRVACSADGERAAVLATGHLSVWNLTARRSVVRRSGPTHGGWLSVGFDPRGRRIVTGGIDSTVAVWDATSDGSPLTTFQWGVGPVYAVTFDRDGLRAAAAGHAGAIVWDIDE